MRTTKQRLEQLVVVANNRGASIGLDWAYGRPRVTNKTVSRDISPRLPTGHLALWLEGFLEGLDAANEAETAKRIAERATL